MTDLYLIAHKVRGEPAFDIAQHMTCPHCQNTGDAMCPACDGAGHWWIIPTSGHRAFPYYNQKLSELGCDVSWPGEPEFERFLTAVPPMPRDLRDHYTTTHEAAVDLTKLFAHLHKPLAPIKRRL